MLIGGGLVMNARIPGICAIFGRSPAMTWSTDERALGPRLQLDVHAALIGTAAPPPPNPTWLDEGRQMFGSCATIAGDLLLVPDHLLEADALRAFGVDR